MINTNHSLNLTKQVFKFINNDEIDKIKSIISKGDIKSFINDNGNTTLMYALENDKNEIANYLIETGIDLNSKNSKGQYPLYYCLLMQKEDMGIAILKAYDKFFLKYDYEVVIKLAVRKKLFNILLLIIVQNGLLGDKFDNSLKNLIPNLGIDKVFSLLKDLFIKDINRKGILQAILNNDLIMFLVLKYIYIEKYHKFFKLEFLILFCIKQKRIDFVRELLKKEEITESIIKILEDNKLENIIKLLIDQKRYKPNIDVINQLIDENKKDLVILYTNNNNNFLVRAFEYALKSLNKMIYRQLFDKLDENYIHSNNDYLFETLWNNKDFDLALTITPTFTSDNINSLSYDNVIQVIEIDHNFLITLIENGLDINICDNSQNSLLMYVTKSENIELISKLINYKADINLKNNDGLTALHYSILTANNEISKLLLLNNADINITIENDLNLLDYLIKRDNCELLDFMFDNHIVEKFDFDVYKYLEDIDLNKNSKSVNLINKYLIKTFIKKRDIQYLYHVTNIKNLESILLNGILSIHQLKSKNIKFIKNDTDRLDGRYDYISSTMSRINSKYLIKIKDRNPEEKYCSIALDSRLIYEANCLFFWSNAARSNFRGYPSRMYKGYKKLKSLFRKEIPVWSSTYQTFFTRSRVNDRIAINEPTDIQAEVMLPKIIKTEYIKKIIFEDEECYLANKELINKYKITYEINRKLY